MNNGLIYRQGREKSNIDSFNIDDLEKVLNIYDITSNSGFLYIAYMDHGVVAGFLKEDNLIFNKKIDICHIKNIRIFNPRKEMYIYRVNDFKFNYRCRQDKYDDLSYDDVEYIECNQILISENKRELNDYIELSNGKGNVIKLPKTDVNNNFDRLALKTRYYIDYESNNAYIADVRFIEVLGVNYIKNCEGNVYESVYSFT